MEIVNLGRMAYREAWEIQKERNAALVASSRSDEWSEGECIFIVEHLPVYTLGFHGNAGNLLVDERRLSQDGTECVRIERGGDITYHGPGQLVVYPLVNIARRGIGVKKYIELLEASVREFLMMYGVESGSNDEAIGVWIDWGKENARKICAIGVKVSHGVTMHGLALNLSTDLRAFEKINPCGFTDKGVTSLLAEGAPEVDFNQAGERLAEIIRRRINEASKG